MAVAVNPVTNKVYVANIAGHSVTVIDGGPVTVPTSTGLSGPKSAKVNKALKLTGTVTPAPANGKKVTITKTRQSGKKWKSAGSAKVTVKKGKFTYSFKPATKGKWRFVATYLNSKSAVVTVTVKAKK